MARIPVISLAPFTTVSKLWQALYEPHIYRHLHVHSKQIQRDGPLKCTLTLERLKEITSGPPCRVARRSWIQEITYYAVVPHHLEDYTRSSLDGYSAGNSFRCANNRAFSEAIIGLFDVLSFWDQGSAKGSSVSISLHLGLYGERKYLPNEQSESATEFEEMARAHTFEYTDGATRSVIPYNAKFLSEECPILPDVSCVSSVSFDRDWCGHGQENSIWAGAALDILQHFNDVRRIFLDLAYFIRPDQVEALRNRREGATHFVLNSPPGALLTIKKPSHRSLIKFPRALESLRAIGIKNTTV